MCVVSEERLLFFPNFFWGIELRDYRNPSSSHASPPPTHLVIKSTTRQCNEQSDRAEIRGKIHTTHQPIRQRHIHPLLAPSPERELGLGRKDMLDQFRARALDRTGRGAAAAVDVAGVEFLDYDFEGFVFACFFLVHVIV